MTQPRQGSEGEGFPPRRATRRQPFLLLLLMLLLPLNLNSVPSNLLPAMTQDPIAARRTRRPVGQSRAPPLFIT